MSIVKKFKTALRILNTKGLRGVYNTIQSKFDHSYRPDETDLVFQLLMAAEKAGVMIDVGAHHGSSLAPFAQLGWQVIAFEPDSTNRAALSEAFGAYDNVIIDPRACSDQPQPAATLFISPESTGVSGLSAFLESHAASEQVAVTTLAEALKEYERLSHPVDFLKIDTEGFDWMVLKGYPWETSPHPKVILCEFEDAKTVSLGYDFHTLAGYLVAHGYSLIISEWHPIRYYGGTHHWRRFATYPCTLANPKGWGNILAVRDQAHYARLRELCGLQ